MRASQAEPSRRRAANARSRGDPAHADPVESATPIMSVFSILPRGFARSFCY